mgnify:CR=1 FL=1
MKNLSKIVVSLLSATALATPAFAQSVGPVSSTTTITRDSDAGTFSRDTSASAAALPIAVVGTEVVVNRLGRIDAASIPPQPAIPISSGTRNPRDWQ